MGLSPFLQLYETTGGQEMASHLSVCLPEVSTSGLAPQFYPAHLIPTDSQTLASWTRMAKPPATLVPRVTQAAGVRGKRELTGAGSRRQDAQAGV